MRHKSLDDILIALMAVVAVISLVVLYGGQLVNRQTDEKQKIASIVEQLKTVKRKRDFYQGWVDVRPGDSLAANDEIYTHAQSSARINFENGPQISLFENSLLRIKKTGDAPPSLALEKGNLNARLDEKTPKLDLEIGKKKYSFESKQANIQIEQGAHENKFLVLDGTASFGEGETKKEIKADQVIIENKETGKVVVKQIPFIPLLPRQDDVIFFNQKKTVLFNWKKQTSDSSSSFIIASDLAFQKVLLKEQTEITEFSYEFNEAGTYYWKIESADGISGPIKSFSLIKETAPTVNLDKDIIYQSADRPGKIFISWIPENNLRPAKNYLVKIVSPSGNAEEKKITGHSYEWSGASFGTHSVSVKVSDSTRPEALWSSPLSVTVKEEKAVEIKNILPEVLEKIQYDNQPAGFSLSWDGPLNDFTYTLTLIRDKKKIEIKTYSPAHLLSLKEPGQYQWSVQGESPSGVKTNTIRGLLQLKRPLKINASPAEGTVIELERPDQLVNFKWKTTQAESYNFELSRNSEFADIVYQTDVKADNVSTVIGKTGKYFWRVKIKGKKSSEFSAPVSVELRPSPPLESPESIPDLNLKLRFQEEPSTTSFEWFSLFISSAMASDPIAVTEWDLPANSRAKEYIVEIYADEEKNNLVARLRSDRPHILWKNAQAGTFYWQVAYVDYWGRQTEFSRLSLLKAEIDEEAQKEAYITIDLENPKHRETILLQAQDKFTFSWEDEKKKNYQFLIAKDLDFEEIIFKKQVKENTLIVYCEELGEAGDYYWKIVSGKYSSRRRQFTAECAEPPAPEEVKADDKEEIPPADPVSTLKFYIAPEREFKLSLFPHKLVYENKAADYSAKVDGLALNSIMAGYRAPLRIWGFNKYDSLISLTRGKVFNTITYSDYELSFKLLRSTTFFDWGPIIGLMKKTLYIEAGRTISDSAVQNPYLGLTLQKNSEDFFITSAIKAGSVMSFGGAIQYKFKERYSAGPFIEITSLKKENATHSFSQIGVQLSYSFFGNKDQ